VIDTLGLESCENKLKVQYNVVKSNLLVFTEEETKFLKEGLDLDPTLDALGNRAVACVRGEQILGKWRTRLEEAICEGANYEEYTTVLPPSTAASLRSG
jgi:hypothetical protein